MEKLNTNKKIALHVDSLFNRLLLSALGLIMLSGCSAKSTISPEEQEALLRQERSYTVSELEYRYDHIPKAQSLGKDISESRLGFQSETDRAFSDIMRYKQELANKLTTQQRYPSARGASRLERTGKNKLPEEESRKDEPEYSGAVLPKEDTKEEEQDIRSVNSTSNMTKYY